MVNKSKPGYKQTKIGLLPEKWEVVRLREVIQEIKNGFASGKRDENGIVQIRMNNVTTDGNLIFDTYLKVPIPESVKDWLLKKGDFLFNNTNSIDLVGKSTVFNEAPFPCTFSNHFTRIRFKQELVLPELILYHFLVLWEKGYFKSVAIRHVGQSAVHTDYLLKLQLPLPPLPEQKKIAEILTTADEAIQKVDEAIEKTERLKKGLLHELLTKGIGFRRGGVTPPLQETEIGKIPEEWEVKSIDEIGTLQYGVTKTATKDDTGIRFLRITDITDQGIKWDGVPYCELTKSELEKYELKQNDVLFARIGATTGKTCFIEKIPQSVYGSYLLRFTPTTEGINTKFIYFFTQSLFYWRQVNANKGGQLKGGLNTKLLGNIKLPLPPLPEQQKISEILSTVDKKLELLREKKERFEKIKKGFMNDLLTGKRRVTI